MACESNWWYNPADVKSKSPYNALKAANVTQKVQNTVDCSFILATVKIGRVSNYKNFWLSSKVIKGLGFCSNVWVIIKSLTLAQI